MSRKPTWTVPMAVACLIGVGLLGVGVTPRLAAAAEYCVSCIEPAGLYRCVIAEGPEGPGTNPAERLKCATDLAQRAGHGACKVSKVAPVPCPGQTVVIAAPIAPPPPPERDIAEDAEQSPEGEKDTTEKEVPDTVEKLAKQTYKSTTKNLQKAGDAVGNTAKKAGDAIVNTAKKTGEGIETAGKAVGGAAKKTWDCVTSLFFDC